MSGYTYNTTCELIDQITQVVWIAAMYFLNLMLVLLVVNLIQNHSKCKCVATPQTDLVGRVQL